MIATLLTIVFLIAMWVAVLAAPVLQNRGSSNKGGDSIKTFQRQLATLERATPYRSAAPRSPGRARTTPLAGPVGRRPLTSAQLAAQRRRNTLMVLVGTAVVSLVGTLTVGGWFLAMHLVADALLVTYVVLMVRTVRMAAEREMKVAFLPHRESGAEPTALLRDVARSRRG